MIAALLEQRFGEPFEQLATWPVTQFHDTRWPIEILNQQDAPLPRCIIIMCNRLCGLRDKCGRML